MLQPPENLTIHCVAQCCQKLPSVVCRSTVYQFRPLPVGWTPARDQALIRGSRPPPAWERRCRSPSCHCSCTPVEEDQDQQGNSIPCQRSFCYLVTFPQMLVPLITIYWHRCPQKIPISWKSPIIWKVENIMGTPAQSSYSWRSAKQIFSFNF